MKLSLVNSTEAWKLYTKLPILVASFSNKKKYLLISKIQWLNNLEDKSQINGERDKNVHVRHSKLQC